MKQLLQTDWARLAAFIDGEGYIQIRREASRKPNHSVRYQLVVTVTNTDELLPTWLKEKFGGRVFSLLRPENGRRRVYHWQCSGSLAYEVLWGCLPYFVIKETQARTGIVFQWTVPEKRKYRNTPERVSLGREILYRHLRDLKQPKPEADLIGKVEVSNVIQ